ncbi:hypothetical protein MRB53_009711 [Persea americana]|uniref:Uncharacterized protein n=1 Tax=Persea americana TaxID=3435 RepID=A0ACC2LQZ3_PERAE|nr:hypothetical protein MRB53_009711 [Persea americana]
MLGPRHRRTSNSLCSSHWTKRGSEGDTTGCWASKTYKLSWACKMGSMWDLEGQTEVETNSLRTPSPQFTPGLRTLARYNWSSPVAVLVTVGVARQRQEKMARLSSAKTTISNENFEVEKFDGTNNFGMWQCEVRDVLSQQELEIALEDKPADMKEKEW